MRKRHIIKTNVARASGQRPTNRWAAWAQTFCERYSSMPIRSRGLRLVLVANRPITFEQVERRYFTSANFLSQIRLAIAPVLRCLNREVSSLFTRSTLKEYATLGHSAMFQTIERDRYSNEMVRILREFHPPATPAASTQRIIQDLSNDHYSSALVRIFNRSLGSREPESAMRRFETFVTHSGLQLLKRIVTERSRLEESVRRGLVTRIHREITPAAQHTTSERTTYEPTPGRNTTSASWANQSGLPIDIEKLTDQVVRNIDGRIVAHRERLGKVF
jgi:hypothetical protein